MRAVEEERETAIVSIKLVVAVTDSEWLRVLSNEPDLEEVNFWTPSPTAFRALQTGELFLFKLRAPDNAIAGGGIFVHADILPWSVAWETFGVSNGAHSSQEMRTQINRYRNAKTGDSTNFKIGCRIIARPFFFDECDWIPQPRDWSPNIVAFKTYDTGESVGRELWDSIQERLSADLRFKEQEEFQRYGTPQLVHQRLGQGSFRLQVIDNYKGSCAITLERTLPALEAAHIRPFAEGGTHEVSNGVLLRRDIHKLFDDGYVTITPQFNFEVSRNIREEFRNGKQYYNLHGQEIYVPASPDNKPDSNALEWHNNNRFRS